MTSLKTRIERLEAQVGIMARALHDALEREATMIDSKREWFITYNGMGPLKASQARPKKKAKK